MAGGRVYYIFEGGNGSQRFGTLSELIKYANTVTTGAVWVDVQGESVEGKRRLMSELSLGMAGQRSPPHAIVDELVEPSESDVVQLQSLHASYVQGVVSCARGSVVLGAADDSANVCVETQDVEPAEGSEERHAQHDSGDDGMTSCAFFATAHLLLTLHDGPFVGLDEMIRNLEMRFTGPNAAGANAFPSGSPSLPSPTGNGGGEDYFATMAAAARQFSTGYALATLTTFTSETMLPDPTALLSEVDCIDEMVLLIAPGARDQPDLLRRVALLRRRISAFRARLYLKEKLLQELVTPAMRGSFVSRDTTAALPLYKDTLDKITQVADRLDDARDILNQANLNFVTGVSMRMSQSSANMDFKMQILGQVATICLPLNLIASIFGMNCTVPWQSDTHPSLHAFFGIVGIMLAWCLICSIPTIRDAVTGNQAKAIVPTDS